MNTSIYISDCNTNYISNGNPATFLKPVVNLSATGNNIKALMKKSGVSARNLQFLMDFPYIQTIYNWTRGINLPTIDNLVVLSKIFNVSINEIVVTDMVEITLNSASEIMSA
ncbi:helix-turn-helix transcriptional regulator [Treponema sp.]|uniref:helix-turn-helix domain-containing protein n=1 Tax=Treponema sp. TaxID=166 RepID=UPI00298EC489|nr:helix-turn-helix transcriptional regulator [Treponema sp.]MCQ2242064.1 helix-turn-helix domain-containing protein [Treponema sp.]